MDRFALQKSFENSGFDPDCEEAHAALIALGNMLRTMSVTGVGIGFQGHPFVEKVVATLGPGLSENYDITHDPEAMQKFFAFVFQYKPMVSLLSHVVQKPIEDIESAVAANNRYAMTLMIHLVSSDFDFMTFFVKYLNTKRHDEDNTQASSNANTQPATQWPGSCEGDVSVDTESESEKEEEHDLVASSLKESGLALDALQRLFLLDVARAQANLQEFDDLDDPVPVAQFQDFEIQSKSSSSDRDSRAPPAPAVPPVAATQKKKKRHNYRRKQKSKEQDIKRQAVVSALIDELVGHVEMLEAVDAVLENEAVQQNNLNAQLESALEFQKEHPPTTIVLDTDVELEKRFKRAAGKRHQRKKAKHLKRKIQCAPVAPPPPQPTTLSKKERNKESWASLRAKSQGRKTNQGTDASGESHAKGTDIVGHLSSVSYIQMRGAAGDTGLRGTATDDSDFEFVFEDELAHFT